MESAQLQIKIKLTNEKKNFMIQINDTEGTDVVFYKACYCFIRLSNNKLEFV